MVQHLHQGLRKLFDQRRRHAGQPGSDRVCEREVAAPVTGEQVFQSLGRIPRHLGVRIDDQRVDAAVRDAPEVALDGPGPVTSASGLPQLRIVEEEIAVAVKEVAVRG